MLATVFAQCAHDHGHRVVGATNHATSIDDVPLWSSADDETMVGTSHDGCAACRFLSENQTVESIQPEPSPHVVGEATLDIPVAYAGGSTSRSTCRAPPIA